MVIDIILVVFFLSSFGYLLYFVSPKIPVLNTVPDETIKLYFEERFVIVTRWYRRIDRLFKEGRPKEKMLEYLCQVLHRIHIWIMRADNKVVSLLKKARTRAGLNGNNGLNGDNTGNSI